MRGTKTTLTYRRRKNFRAVQLLLGHTELERTVRYLGSEVDEALDEMAEQTKVGVKDRLAALATRLLSRQKRAQPQNETQF